MSLSFLDVRYRPLELSVATDSYSRVTDVEPARLISQQMERAPNDRLHLFELMTQAAALLL